jgi:hypothetical protein
LRHQPRPAIRFPAPVDCEIVNRLEEPGTWISIGIKLPDRDDESVLNDLGRILFRKSESPARSTHETDEKSSVDSVESGYRRLGGNRGSTAGGSAAMDRSQRGPR